MSNLSNCIYLKDSRVYVSRNNVNWYREVLAYDSTHPESNYYLAKELEKQKKFKKAQEHYKLAYAGGYNSAIVGLNRLRELEENNSKTESPDSSSQWSKGLILLLILLLLIGGIISYYFFNSFIQKDSYKVFNLREVKKVITEQEVLVHNVDVRKYYAPSLFDTSFYISLKAPRTSSLHDILVQADMFLENKKIANSLEELALVFYYDDVAEINNEYAIAEVTWTRAQGISEIYVYPDFEKKDGIIRKPAEQIRTLRKRDTQEAASLSTKSAFEVVNKDNNKIDTETVNEISTRPDKKIADLIKVDLDKKILTYENQTVKKLFPIGIGEEANKTPTGRFRIANKVLDPKSPRDDISSAEYGKAWLGLSLAGYGIHGTDEPNSIGKEESLGCIRMLNEDILDLYECIKTNTEVFIFTKTLFNFNFSFFFLKDYN